MSSILAQAAQAGAEARNAVPNRPKTNLQGVGAAGGLRAPGASGSLRVNVPASDRIDDDEKLCRKCGEWWPADREFFYVDASAPDGLFYCCKACYHELTHPNASRRPANALAAAWWVEARP